jgi:O-antigen ligase
MATSENMASVDSFERFCSLLAKFSLFVFLLLSFFGIAMPFQDRPEDVSDVTTASPINQFVFSTLYILSFISILPKRHLAFHTIKAEKFLTIFLIWSFITVFWSDALFVSFKRWIRIFGAMIVLLSGLLHLRSTDDAFKYFKIILSVYIPLSILSILFIPGAYQYEFSAWRGIAQHKNTLGQISLVSLIIWSYAIYSDDIRKKLIALIFWGASFILLLGSRSVTSILTAGALFTFSGFLYANRQIFRPVVGSFISSMFFLAFFISLIPLIYLGQDALASVPELLGKDITFSGRLYLWEDVFEDAKSHLFYGCGFGGYWVPGSAAMDRIWGIHYTMFNQAHLGYLDILNETGLIGIMLFTFMVVFYFNNLSKLQESYFWQVFVVSALISNLQESSLFKPMNLVGILFIFSYLALYVKRIKKEFTVTNN